MRDGIARIEIERIAMEFNRVIAKACPVLAMIAVDSALIPAPVFAADIVGEMRAGQMVAVI